MAGRRHDYPEQQSRPPARPAAAGVVTSSPQSAAQSTETLEKCENCTREIGRLETPRVFNGNLVCAECDSRLRAQASAPVPPQPSSVAAIPVPATPQATPTPSPNPSSTDLNPTRIILALAVIGVIVLIIFLLIEYMNRLDVIHRTGAG